MSGAVLDPRLHPARAAPKQRMRLSWSDPKFRSIVWQVLVVGILVAIVAYLVRNTNRNLAARHIATGFAFLSRSAGIPIGEHVIEYDPAISTYGDALLIGILNTLKVAVVGIVLTTVWGTPARHRPAVQELADLPPWPRYTWRCCATSRCCCNCSSGTGCCRPCRPCATRGRCCRACSSPTAASRSRCSTGSRRIAGRSPPSWWGLIGVIAWSSVGVQEAGGNRRAAEDLAGGARPAWWPFRSSCGRCWGRRSSWTCRSRAASTSAAAARSARNIAR